MNCELEIFIKMRSGLNTVRTRLFVPFFKSVQISLSYKIAFRNQNCMAFVMLQRENSYESIYTRII